MTIALERRVFYLCAEFLAHTFVFGAFSHSARAVTAFCDKPVADGFNHFFIFVKP